MNTQVPAEQSLLVGALLAIAGVLIGAFIGGVANMTVLVVGGKLVPPPEGVDINKIETIQAHIGEYTLVQLMVPWVAHAGGTFVGALLATLIAGRGRRALIAALVVGALFQAGGTAAVFMIPAPAWFNTLDLVFAYFPMALLAWWLVRGRCSVAVR